MRRQFFLIFALSCVSHLWAAPISLEKAAMIARNHLASAHEVQLVAAEMQRAHRAQSQEGTPENDLYIFNINEDEGFIIISGDDRAVPVLGYCDHGHFDLDEAPCNLRWWLSFYEESIQQIREANLPEVPPAPLHNRPTDVVEPLLKTQWNQDYPYNLQCPISGGAHCPSGCLATALAQVMYHHKHPQDACEGISGYHVSSINTDLPALEPTVFDWDHMKKHYNQGDTGVSCDAVAELMRYCGQMMRMEYHPAGSGTQPYRLPDDLPNYFHYPKTIHLVDREPYSIGEWDELLLNELQHDRPVLYCGYTVASEGHAFVCDGYNGKGLYHINWGWGGLADGDYRISVLDAKDNGIGGSSSSMRFSLDQMALVGVQAEGEDDFTPIYPSIAATSRPSLLNGNHFMREDTSEDFNGVEIGLYLTMSVDNGRGQSRLVGIGLFDEENQLVSNLVQNERNFWNNYPSDYIPDGLNFGHDIESGHYFLKPIVFQDDTWMAAYNADMNYVDVVIDGLEMNLTSVPKAHFHVTSVEKIGGNLSVTMENPDEEYNGYMILLKMNAQGDYDFISFEKVAIEAESTRTILFYLGDNKLDIDNDIFALLVDDLGGEIFYTNVYSDNSLVSKAIEIRNLNEEDNTVYGDRVLCKVDLANLGTGHYHHFLQMSLVDENGIERANGFKKIVDLAQNATTTLDVELPVSNFSSPFKIKTTLYDGENNKVDSYTEMFNVAKGAYYWTADGGMHTMKASATFKVPEDALAISVRNAYTSDVKANSNPNTIYLLDKSVPKGLKGKNNFNYENKSGSLSLTDGYDYFIPLTIDVTGTVSYTRTFGSDEVNRWSSVCLPFSPATIATEEQTLKLFVNEADKGKDLWLMEWDRIEGDKAYFNLDTTFCAHTPYLIAVNAPFANKPIVFSTSKVSLSPSTVADATVSDGVYCFRGFHATGSYEHLYAHEGTRFVLQEEASNSQPFRASFLTTSDAPFPTLYLQGHDITDGIITVVYDQSATPGSVYNLAGQRMDNAAALPKGIYIIDGKKTVVR